MPPNETPARMIGRTISHYRIEESLGAGGMGVVYRAFDERLNRDVALKVLPPETSSSEAHRKQLRREALALSKLSHRHIAHIYDFDTVDGTAFLVMEYIRGRTLAAKIAAGPLTQHEARTIGLQIASALADASDAGIVHRDLKPSNIMLSAKDGDVKVLDFGLARLFGVSELDLTRSSDQLVDTAGTLPYMSPEQIRGEQPDPRSDIYSLGAILYETTSGQRPFTSTNAATLISHILTKTPAKLHELNPGLSSSFENVVLRCLSKDPERRYQRASELTAALESVDDATSTHPTHPTHLAAPLSSSLWKFAVALLLLIILAACGLLFWKHRRKPAPIASSSHPSELAILPLESPASPNTDSPSDAAFNNGLVETLTSRLTQLSSAHPLEVVPQSELRTHAVTNLEEAKQQFGATLGLQLTVERSGDMIRVNYALIDAAQHRQLRGDTITAPAADPFGLEDKVSESVVEALNIELNPVEQAEFTEHGTSQPRAFDYYLQGRGYLEDFQKSENIDSAITEFQHALQQDVNYSFAYAGLGEAFYRKYQFSKDSNWITKAKDACQHSISLKPDQPEGHNCLGLIDLGTGAYEQGAHEYQLSLSIQPASDAAVSGLAVAYEHQNNFAEAERTFHSAIALKPSYWVNYNWLGELYLNNAKFKEAEPMFSQVIALSPDSFVGYTNLGITYVSEGRYSEAKPLLERSVGMRPATENTSNLATAYFQLHEYDKAVRNFEQAVKLNDKYYEVWGNLADAYYWAPGMRDRAPAAYKTAISLAQQKLEVNPRDALCLGYLAGFYAMLGDRDHALLYLNRALQLSPDSPDVLLDAAEVYNQLGKKDAAIEYCEKTVAAGTSPSTLRDLPNFDNLRANPRFSQLTK